MRFSESVNRGGNSKLAGKTQRSQKKQKKKKKTEPKKQFRNRPELGRKTKRFLRPLWGKTWVVRFMRAAGWGWGGNY